MKVFKSLSKQTPLQRLRWWLQGKQTDGGVELMDNGHQSELSKRAPVNITAAVNHSMRAACRPTIMTRTAPRALLAPVEARNAKGANS